MQSAGRPSHPSAGGGGHTGRLRGEWRDRLVGSDPGLNRFRMAAGGVVAMGSVLGVEYLYADQTGAGSKGSLIAMLLGAVVAMMGSVGLSGTARYKGITALFFPVAIGLGMVVGAAVAPHRDLLLGVFVVVMFIAVYVRRFGPRFFIYGFMGWMGYFFASFLGASFGSLPTLMADVALASAWVLLLSLTVLRAKPDHVLRRTLDAFAARARGVAAASVEVLGGEDVERRERHLHSRQVRLNEAALMIEGQLGDALALPDGWSAADLRRWLVDAQLAIEGLAMSALRLSKLSLSAEAEGGAESGAVAESRAVVSGLATAGVRVAAALAAGDLPAIEAAAAVLLDAALDDSEANVAPRHEARHMAIAAIDYSEVVRHWSSRARTAEGEDTGDFEPAITLMMGNLPGSAATAREVAPGGGRWNPLSRLDLPSRQAIQVALAGGLAILAGRELSSTRYYWAVIAAFVVFSGTATRSETVIKGANRVVGTVVGLGLAIVLANLTAGNTLAVVVVILASMFCGFYLLRVSYAFMIFFITIMVAQLYSVLHEFTGGLLVLRLEETAIGAAIGITVALGFLSVSTRATARAARAGFYTAVHDLLEGAADRLADPTGATDPDALARSVDSRLQQLNLVLLPLTRALMFSSDAKEVRHRLTLYGTCATHSRALSAALRHSQPGGTPARLSRATELAGASRTMAGAAAILSEGDRVGALAAGAVERLDLAAATLGRRSEPTSGPAADLVDHALYHLDQALRQLAGSPAAVPAHVPPAASPEALVGPSISSGHI